MRVTFRAILAMISATAGPAFAQAINPDVTQDNIKQTICVPGWSKSVRPPVSYTNKIKLGLMHESGIDPSRASEFELDHLVSIEIGGNPRDPKNLWLQPWDGPDGAHAKDKIENMMHRAVCKGQIPLATAQECMAKDWHSCPATLSTP